MKQSSAMIAVGEERHGHDAGNKTLAAYLDLKRRVFGGTGSLDIGHGDRALERGRETARCDSADLLIA
ncbi:hypothetical protein NS277_16515, partial [Novosphingobium barchaimii]